MSCVPVGGGRTGTQDSVLCSGRVRVGGGPKHRTVSCVPVVFWPSWLKDPVKRSRISACCPGRGGPAAWYRRLASIAFHTILFTAAGLGVYCNPSIPPLAFAMFFRTNRFKSNQVCPPSFTTAFGPRSLCRGGGGATLVCFVYVFSLKNRPKSARKRQSERV